LVLAVVVGVASPAMLGLLGPSALSYAIFRVYVRRPEQHELLFELYDLELLLCAPAWALAAAFVSA
ncbi:MAG TPA: hypothetical protein VG755_38955, partial [Nannocystaceae bacterium]|nr:hypothetical protein [Nannocystaceae bacterium]